MALHDDSADRICDRGGDITTHDGHSIFDGSRWIDYLRLVEMVLSVVRARSARIHSYHLDVIDLSKTKLTKLN